MSSRSLPKGNADLRVSPDTEHSRDLANHSHLAVREKTHQLGLSLQTTLDVYELIRTFHKESQPLTGHYYLEYQNPKTQHGIALGALQEQKVEFNLEVEDRDLGKLILSRKEPFTKQSMFQIENVVQHLIYPLRNALQYHEAVVQSLTCPLTQLGNKKAYHQSVVREVEFATRHSTPFSLVVIDVDNFKKINDSFGHQAGDHVLAIIGKLMEKTNRNSDMSFRVGGEEFVMLLSNTSKDGAIEVANRLRQIVKETDFTFQGSSFPVTLSMGLANLSEGDTSDRLFARADQALYQAKHTGKNKIVSWD